MPKPELRNIKTGDIVFVEPTAMRVTNEMDCYLNPAAAFQVEKSILHTLRVKRAQDSFHVAVLAHVKWTPDTSREEVTNWLPVASIREDYDRDVDFEGKSKKK